MELKIYFAGSISGGRGDRSIYLEMIEELKQYGQVLTEHIGDDGLSNMGEDGQSDEWIYKRDIEWIREADILVAEVTTPSLGVGYEIGFAEKLGKKILCLYREGENKRLSAMIAGNPNVQVARYRIIPEALQYCAEFIANC